jgi:hypothetical protein
MQARLFSYGPAALLAFALFVASPLSHSPRAIAQAQGTCNTFQETQQTVCGLFLQYWQTHGGLSQQGFPISGELGERSDADGKVYTVQYFERAVFELHPENPSPNDILLSLLGSFRYKAKYPDGAPPQQPNATPGTILFKETGKSLGGVFLDYWQAHGGLAQQGFPISDEFTEVSDLDGKPYTVQYFERAVFELHPENPPASGILLSQLGTFQYKQKSAAGGWVAAPNPVPPAQPSTPAAPTATTRPAQGPTPTTQVQPPTPAPPPSSGNIIISTIFYNGLENPSEGDEYITIKNTGATGVDIQGYRINAGSPGQDFTFPSFVLNSGAEVRVYTNHDAPGSFSFHSSKPLWNNSGDCGYLYDPHGTQVSKFCY